MCVFPSAALSSVTRCSSAGPAASSRWPAVLSWAAGDARGPSPPAPSAPTTSSPPPTQSPTTSRGGERWIYQQQQVVFLQWGQIRIINTQHHLLNFKLVTRIRITPKIKQLVLILNPISCSSLNFLPFTIKRVRLSLRCCQSQSAVGSIERNTSKGSILNWIQQMEILKEEVRNVVQDSWVLETQRNPVGFVPREHVRCSTRTNPYFNSLHCRHKALTLDAKIDFNGVHCCTVHSSSASHWVLI